MIKEFKEIKNQLDLRKKEYECDLDGRVVVEMRVRNDDQFLSPYSTDAHSVISSEVADFLDHNLKSVSSDKRIRLKIFSDSIDDKEKNEYVGAIREHYKECYRNVKQEKTCLMELAFLMSIVSVLALCLMIWLDIAITTNAVALEIIDIFAWVFMWEAVDIFFLQCTLLRYKEKRYLSMVDSKIEFLPLTTREN